MLLGMEFNVSILKVPKSAPFTRCIALVGLLVEVSPSLCEHRSDCWWLRTLEHVLPLQVGGLALPPVTELFFKPVTGSEMVDRIHMSLNAKFRGGRWLMKNKNESNVVSQGLSMTRGL